MVSNGYKALMGVVRDTDDFDYDPWGSNISWLFALAEVAQWNYAATLPDFHPGLFEHTRESLCEDSWEAGLIIDMLDDGRINRTDIEDVYRVLSRYDNILRLAGRNY